MPNKLSRFWQELNRRNVVRVITVYTGAAFVILSLVDMIREPFELPNWSFKLIVVILSIGLIIAVILSWIYDINPEGGMVKTEPADKIKPGKPPGSSKGWKVASYISFVVIVGLIVLNILSHKKESKEIELLDKSIAVLPFINESPEEQNAYFINGIMEEVTLNLQAIKELRVPGRTSVEQYRTTKKSISEVAEELGVNYIVEGFGQKYGDNIVLRVYLLEGATDRQLWGNSYKEEINNTGVIIEIQSQIAQSIAAELQAVITPSEKELMENVPTTSISAFDLYQRGKEAYWRYWLDRKDTEALERAEYSFNEALKYDPTFAQAYTGLARVNWNSEGYYSENYLDTVRILLDKALTFNPKLAEAHTLFGRYFNDLNDTIRAMREVDKAISLNPNDWEAYSVKAEISSDFIDIIRNRQKAVLLNRGPELPELLMDLGRSYWNIGFPDKATALFEEVLKLTGDSIRYFYILGGSEIWNGNLTASIAQLKHAFALNSTNWIVAYTLFFCYTILNEKEQALKYGKIWIDLMNLSEESEESGVWYFHRIGYYYWLKGLTDEADHYFNLQIDYGLREIELERNRAERERTTYYDLAATYAFIEETEKALENLRIYISRPVMNLFMLGLIKFDPLFDPIRNNPEFQQIVNGAEAKYQAEHEQVRQWLEENDML